MTILNDEFVKRIKRINWFARCGQPIQLDLALPIVSVASVSEAITCCKQLAWENTQLDACGTLTVHLSRYFQEEYKDWNHHVDEAKKILQATALPQIESYAKHMGLERIFLDCVSWDLVGVIMEEIYAFTNPPVNFYRQLFCVYEAGHFPCGWIDGEWPEGKLAII